MTESDQILFEFAEQLTEKGKMNAATGKQLDRLLATYRHISEEEIRSFVANLEPDLRREYKKAYYKYINGGYKQHFPGVKAYRLEDMKPAYRKEVQNSVDNSLALIKTQNQEFMRKMQDRFRNWATIPTPEMRGPQATTTYLRLEIMKAPEVREEMTAHQHFIIEDQTRKLIANMNEITASESGAIAFIWHNRRDKKVTGAPGGLNKPTEKHGDHWEREGKLYLVKGSWALKRGLLKKTPDVWYDTDIPDGKPGMPVGCRCYSSWITDIESIPEAYRDLLTEKGREYLK